MNRNKSHTKLRTNMKINFNSIPEIQSVTEVISYLVLSAKVNDSQECHSNSDILKFTSAFLDYMIFNANHPNKNRHLWYKNLLYKKQKVKLYMQEHYENIRN